MSDGGIMRRLTGRFTERTPVVPVLRLSGPIGAAGGFGRGLSLAGLAGSIERAFALTKAPAVALAINSPGGAPVQAALIAGRIRELAAEKDKRVIAFVEDIAASGGYWLACAADEIFADESSVVGSIGVISAGFGFDRLLDRIGIERRVHTAGLRKAMLDPFAAEKPEDVETLKSLQTDVHSAFITYVRARRGNALKDGDKSLFEGEFWTGRRALDLGLVDGIGHMRSVLRDRFGERVRLKLVQAPGGWRRRLRVVGGAEASGEATRAVLDALGERLMYARYGL